MFNKIFCKKNKKKIALFGAGVVAVALCSVSVLLFNAQKAKADSYANLNQIPESVFINGEKFTKDNKYTIIELVPERYIGSWGYFVGGDSMPVKESDARALYAYVGNYLKTHPSFTTKNKDGGTVTITSVDQVMELMAQAYSTSCYPILKETGYSDGSNYNAWYQMCDPYGNYGDAYQEWKYGGGNSDKHVNDRNFLGNILFGDSDNKTVRTLYSDMTDKIEIRTVKDTELTYDDLINADFVYVDTKYHDASVMAAYKQMSYLFESLGLSTTYAANGFSRDYYVPGQVFNNTTTLNIREDLAFYMYRKSIMNSMPIAIDWTGAGAAKNLDNKGYYKLNVLSLGIETDQFYNEYCWSEKYIKSYNFDGTVTDSITSNTRVAEYYYDGDNGWVTCTGTDHPVLDIFQKEYDWYGQKRTNEKLEWNDGMFIGPHGNNWGNNDDDYYSSSNWGTFIHNNIVAFNGDNALDQSFNNGGFGANLTQKGTDYDLVQDQYEREGNNVLWRDMIKYVIGVYSLNKNMVEINVLEIEPWGQYQFNNGAGANKVLTAFGVRGDNYEISDEKRNFDDDVKSPGEQINTYSCTIKKNDKDYHYKVRSMSVNAFNGITDDLNTTYDLIIMGTYNDGNANTSLTGDRVVVKNSPSSKTQALTGNDITDRMYEKLKAYVEAGLAVLEVPNVYNGDTSYIADNTNYYNMRYEKLENFEKLKNNGDRPNVATIKKTIRPAEGKDNILNFNVTKVLHYPFRNRFTVVSPVEYNGTVAGTVRIGEGETVSDKVKFSFRAEDTIPAGSHIKLYIDRNADSLYNEVDTKDMREIYADYTTTSTIDAGSIYQVNLSHTLPSNWFGYFRYRLVVTSGGIASAYESGFAIYPEKTRTVKVLQIVNTKDGEDYDTVTAAGNDPVTMKLTPGSPLANAFAATETITNMKLDVTVKNISELEEFLNDDPEYFSIFSIVVVGFRDSYGKSDTTGVVITENSNVDKALNTYIENGNSVLFTHDTMAYNQSNISSPPYLTAKYAETIGMQGSSLLTNSLISKLDKFSMFSKIAASGSTKITTDINQLNVGQVTEYPYKVNKHIEVRETHGQFNRLNLEHIPTYSEDYSGNKTELSGVYDNDVTVWYTLGCSEDDYFNVTGQDAISNYYIYSKGNVTYTSAGHRTVSDGAELELFVNTLVRSILVSAVPPEIEITNGVNTTGTTYDIVRRKIEEDNVGAESTDIPAGVAGANVPAGLVSKNLIELKFKATDEDLTDYDSTRADNSDSQFNRAYVYLDYNENGTYDKDTEPMIMDYGYGDACACYSGKEETLNLYTLTAYDSTVHNKMMELYVQNKLRVGIYVQDSSRSVGQAYGLYIRRNFFELG